jgi:uncharacterized protein (DUF342 family)
MKLTAEAEQYIDQLELLTKQFNFYENECAKLDSEAIALQQNTEDTENSFKIDKLSNKMEELYVRYNKDRKIYLEIITKVKSYFFNKYGVVIDLEKYL